MLDCHQHIRAEDLSTPEKRAEYAEWTREEMDRIGIDQFALMPYPANDLEGTIERNKNTAALLDEHPDLGYAWVYIDPRWGEGAVDEFRRAVQEDGFLGLKHHSNRFHQPLSDPETDPLLQAANDMGVPVISHVTQRTREHRENVAPYETQTEHVREVAERYPDLTIISGHMAAGGDWERRLRNLTDLDNVYLDIGGSDCSRGQVEAAKELLGIDRLIFGTDGWLLPDVGKLTGSDLTAEEKAEIAYNLDNIVPMGTKNKLSAEEVEERRAAAADRFERFSEPREEEIVEINGFVGEWPYADVEGSPEQLIERMDREGIDKALVSSMAATHRRNVPQTNRELFETLNGYEDRLIPVATVDPTYTKWRDDLAESADRGARAVKMLPLYHGYALDEEPAEELLAEAAAHDLPVIICSVLEDLRKQHPTHKPWGSDEMFRDRWNDDQVDALIDLLKACPETDVVIDHAWTSAPRILEETRSRLDNHWLRNRSHEGQLLFTMSGLFIYYDVQAREIAETVGVDHLAFSAKLPFNVVQSYYSYVEHLPVDDEERAKVQATNALDLIE